MQIVHRFSSRRHRRVLRVSSPPSLHLRMVAGCLLLALLAVLLTGSQPAVMAQGPVLPLADNYPPDPINDIKWGGGSGSLSEIIANFNRARHQENAQLGTKVPDMPLPAAATWNAMVPAERALWLINQERLARGIAPLHGLEKNVTEVAQAWAEWLLKNNAWGHTADGRDPKARLNDKPAIKACQDFLGVSENLAWFGTTVAPGIPEPIERAVYRWMYDDSDSAWGHRHAILWNPYTENSGPGDREGFLGIGHARGPYTAQTSSGPKFYPYTDMVVMNVFDPCSTWVYADPPKPPTPPAPPPVVVPDPPPSTHTVSGVVAPPRWVTISRQDFEVGSWPGGWRTSDADGAAHGEYMWIPATCRVHSGTYSGMAVGGGADGRNKACADHYPNLAKSWLIYGPFSLADAIAAELRADVWVHTEPNVDLLCMMASLDGKAFHGVCVSGASSSTVNPEGWVGELLDLHRVPRMGSLLGKPQVYVAYIFTSNEAVTLPHMGAYVDNIELRKAVAQPAQAAQIDGGDGTTASGALVGVTVSSNQGVSTMTDRDGAFQLKGLAPGRHILTFSLPGHTFYPAQVELNVNRDIGGVTVVGSTTQRHWNYLPTLLRGGARAATATTAAGIPAGVTVREASFQLDCDGAQCRLIGPLD